MRITRLFASFPSNVRSTRIIDGRPITPMVIGPVATPWSHSEWRMMLSTVAANPVGDMVIGNCAPSGFHSAGFGAGGRGDLTALCLLRLLGDDVDHSVYGIGSPHHSPRTPYHFDLLYVAHGDIDRVPDDAGKQRRPARASPTTNGSNCANERDARGEAGEAARLRETAAPRAPAAEPRVVFRPE